MTITTYIRNGKAEAPTFEQAEHRSAVEQGDAVKVCSKEK